MPVSMTEGWGPDSWALVGTTLDSPSLLDRASRGVRA